LARGGPDEAALKLLVDAARRGDANAPEDLVRMTWTSTYTLAFRLTGNEEDALDVTQETYLRAFRPGFTG
jgi:RNA polymerase sigma-70 factor (ECF subfamily)